MRCATLLVVAAPLLLAASPPPRAKRDDSASMSSERYAGRLFDLVNAERRRRGLRSLRSDRCAAAYATRWSAQLARSERLRHQSLRPMLMSCRARRAAENIAAGDVPAERVLDTWMRSSGHRANILNGRLDSASLAAARSASGRWYIVQDFLGD